MLPPPAEFTTELLAGAVRGAVPKVVAEAPPAPHGRLYEVRWGRQVDTQAIHLTLGGRLSAETVAAYVAKYATKQPELLAALDRRITCAGDIETLGLNDHLRRMVTTAWCLGGEEHLAELNLKLWAHQLGFRGHWLTKSRRYATTFTALRQARLAYRQTQDKDAGASDAGHTEIMQAARERTKSWRFCGAGYRTHADVLLAKTARQAAQEGRRVLRDQRARAAGGDL